MIEGIWTGYRSEQQRTCHRHYVSREKQADAIKAIGYSILFSDNTELILRVTKVSRRKEPANESYTSLIDSCVLYGVSSVADVIAKQSAAKQGASP